MDAKLAEHVRQAAQHARTRALNFAGPAGKDGLAFAVVEKFDAGIRGHVERDRRIEDERDRVLIAAVKLAETPPDAGDEVEAARAHLIDAVDYLEQAVLRFGIVNREGARRGHGEPGQPVTAPTRN